MACVNQGNSNTCFNIQAPVIHADNLGVDSTATFLGGAGCPNGNYQCSITSNAVTKCASKSYTVGQTKTTSIRFTQPVNLMSVQYDPTPRPRPHKKTVKSVVKRATKSPKATSAKAKRAPASRAVKARKTVTKKTVKAKRTVAKKKARSRRR